MKIKHSIDNEKNYRYENKSLQRILSSVHQ